MNTIVKPLTEMSRKLLEAVFGDKVEDAWVCWKSNMRGKRVRNLVAGDLPEDEDCYYCPTLMKPGAVSRTNANAKRVYCLVLDDVGTKLSKEGVEMMLPLPSYTVESSPGNFQYGYIIENGMEPDDYRALRVAMKSNPIWGKADGTALAQPFRLPQGTNTKPQNGGWGPK